MKSIIKWVKNEFDRKGLEEIELRIYNRNGLPIHQKWTPNWKIDRWEEMTRIIEYHIQLLGGKFVFN